MGCYDTVTLTCPLCGHQNHVQSKAGNCSLSEYRNSAPADIAYDLVTNYKGVFCTGCNTELEIVSIANLQHVPLALVHTSKEQ